MNLIAGGVLALVMLAGCAGTSTETASLSATSTAPNAGEPSTTGTPEPATTRQPTPSPTEQASSLEESAPPGDVFVDPEGHYEMVVSDDWIASHGALAEGIEVWAVPPAQNEFMTNVNVLTQTIGDMTLDEYLALSVESVPRLMSDGEVIAARTLLGSRGSELAVMEYTGTQNSQALRFLGVFVVSDGRAVVATLTSLPDAYDQTRAEIEPYLLTLTSSRDDPAGRAEDAAAGLPP